MSENNDSLLSKLNIKNKDWHKLRRVTTCLSLVVILLVF